MFPSAKSGLSRAGHTRGAGAAGGGDKCQTGIFASLFKSDIAHLSIHHPLDPGHFPVLRPQRSASQPRQLVPASASRPSAALPTQQSGKSPRQTGEGLDMLSKCLFRSRVGVAKWVAGSDPPMVRAGRGADTNNSGIGWRAQSVDGWPCSRGLWSFRDSPNLSHMSWSGNGKSKINPFVGRFFSLSREREAASWLVAPRPVGTAGGTINITYSFANLESTWAAPCSHRHLVMSTLEILSNPTCADMQKIARRTPGRRSHVIVA